MKITKLITLFCMAFVCTSLMAQNPKVVNGVATYTANKNIGPKYPVPDSWNKIVIKSNVTITGSFYMGDRTAPIEIAGESSSTSIIQGDGSRPTDDGINGRSYSAIRCDGSPDVFVHDLKITKPMKFHIHGGFGNVTVQRCSIIAGTETATTDGIHGGKGKTVVKDCYIDVYDDALYTSECKLVENTTIVHNKNGSPFMTSWGGDVPAGAVCIIRNCKVIEKYNGTDYNHGVVGWAEKDAPGSSREQITLKFEGTFSRTIATGKKAGPFYTIGRPSNSQNPPPQVNNAHIVVDGLCPFKTSIQLRPSSSNSSVTFKNCPAAQAPTGSDDVRSGTLNPKALSRSEDDDNAVFGVTTPLYPNPATDQLNIDLSDYAEKATVEIYNIQGSLAYKQTSEPTLLAIPIEDWKSGIYLVHIKTNNQSNVQKLIVQ